MLAFLASRLLGERTRNGMDIFNAKLMNEWQIEIKRGGVSTKFIPGVFQIGDQIASYIELRGPGVKLKIDRSPAHAGIGLHCINLNGSDYSILVYLKANFYNKYGREIDYGFLFDLWKKRIYT